MSKKIPVSNTVAVLLDQGPDIHPRWKAGSGFLIGGTRVLTAAHNVAGRGQLFIQLKGAEKYTAMIIQMGNVNQGLDLAIIKVTDPRFRDASVANVQFATLNRNYPDRLPECFALGFPRFKARKLSPPQDGWLREYIQIDGYIPLASNVKSGMLELRVTADPQASLVLGSSEWEGMSGAVVFVRDPNLGDCAIGVLIEHYPAEGSSSLTAVPVTVLSDKLDEPTARHWWDLLGVDDPYELPSLPLSPEKELIAAEAIYREQVINKYQPLDFGAFNQSKVLLAEVPLEKIFVRLSLTVEKVIRGSESSGEASWAGRWEHRQQEPKTVQEPIELGQAIGKHVLIVGEPGAGKSTLLHWFAVTFAQGIQREPSRLGSLADADRLPILVDLGQLDACYLEGRETPNWFMLLPEYLARQPDFHGTPPQLFTHALDKGRCLLLFDGLDEIADRQARARVAHSLFELARLSHSNRVIIGSRPAGIGQSEAMLSLQFQRCQIERFKTEEIQQFFRFWYALDRELTAEQQCEEADGLFVRVQATSQILQLATTPLLSTIFLLIWRYKGDLPELRVDLYEQCCQMLIEQWEHHHRVSYKGIFAKLGWERHLRLLAPLAHGIHKKKERSAYRKDLIEALSIGLQKEGLCSNKQEAGIEAEDFLETLSLRSGLLQYMGNEQYGFPHQTFQEYLAARYIADQPGLDEIYPNTSAMPTYIDLVMAHLQEAWWQEVHLLAIAHLGSKKEGASKAAALMLTILHIYPPPSRVLRFRYMSLSQIVLGQIIGLGKRLPQLQLERRIAWILAREFELVARGYAECVIDRTISRVGTTLSIQAATLIQQIIYNEDRAKKQKALLTVACQLLRRQGNEVAEIALGEALRYGYGWPVNSHKVYVKRRAERILELVEKAGNETVVSGMLAALHDADEDVQGYAAENLGQMRMGNETAESALLMLLHDVDKDVRRRVVRSLGQVEAGNEAAESALLEALLHNVDKDVRRRAAMSLGQMRAGNEAVVSSLVKALRHDTDEDVRERAAMSLGRVGVGNAAAVRVLLEVLRDTSGLVRRRAARSLGQMGMSNEEVVSTMLALLQDADFNMCRIAAMSLGRVGVGNAAAVSVLLEALHDTSTFVRSNAARSLGRVEAGNEAVVSALVKALRHDTDEGVRVYAAMSLGQVGVGIEAVVRALLEALHDTSTFVRRYAVESLCQMGVGNEEIVSSLLALLHNVDKDEQQHIAVSLGQMGVNNEEVVRALLEMLHMSNARWDMRSQAARSLGQVGVGNEEVMWALLEVLLYDVDEGVQQSALSSLRQLGASNEKVVGALLILLQDADENMRKRAARSLGQVGVGSEEVVRILLGLLQDADEYVREHAARSLGQVGVGNEEVVRALLTAMQHDVRENVRSSAAESLGLMEIKDTTQLRQVLIALNRCLYGSYSESISAQGSIRQLLDGRPIPGYHWVPLQKQQVQHLRFKRIVFWLSMIAIIVTIGLAATWLLGILNPNSFLMHFLLVLAGIIVIVATVTQILGRILHAPWEQP